MTDYKRPRLAAHFSMCRNSLPQQSFFVTFAASEWGWIAFPHGEEFGLVDASVMSGWVRIGAKRMAEDHLKQRRGDRSVLVKMRDALKRREQNDNNAAGRALSGLRGP